jgi:T5SS/PEP-CTERM-associated repeat protein
MRHKLAWPLAAACLLVASGAVAQDTAIWQGGAGTWSNSNNWVCPPPPTNHCVPQANFDVIGNGSPGTITVDVSVTVNSVLFSDPFHVIVGGTSLTAGDLSIPQLTINGGGEVQGRTATSQLIVTGDGSQLNGGAYTLSGTLTVTNGGVVNGNGHGQVSLGGGQSLISGQGSAVNGAEGFTIAPGGALSVTDKATLTANGNPNVSSGIDGALHITSGAIVTNGGIAVGDGGPAAATVNVVGATWNNTFLGVGSLSTGSLNVTNQGLVTYTGVATIGSSEGVTGVVSVADSKFLGGPTSQLRVGLSGAGELALSNGAEAAAAQAVVGLNAGSTGKLQLTGSSDLLVGSLTIGSSGVGTLTILHGSTVKTDGAATIGASTTTAGTSTVSVAGVDSKFTVQGALTIGGQGPGSLTILDKAVVESQSATIGRSHAAGPFHDNAVLVEDAKWNVSGPLIVGDGNNGRLDISFGGEVTSGRAVIGAQENSKGIVTVTSPNTNPGWDVIGDLIVGGKGRGELTISDGGKVVTNVDAFVGLQSANAPPGNDPNSTGVVKISGRDPQNLARESSWWVKGGLVVGGIGTVTVEGGADLTTGYAVIGTKFDAPGDSTSKVTVSGAGSRWDSALKVDIGFEGPGRVEVNDHAVADAPFWLVFPQGVLSIKDSTVMGEEVHLLQNGKLKGADPAPLNVIADLLMDPGSILQLAVEGWGPGQFDQLRVTGDVTFHGDLHLDFMNGFAPTAGASFDLMTYTGALLWNPGNVLFNGILAGNLFKFDIFSDRVSMVALNNWVSTSSPGGPGDPPVPEPSSLLMFSIGAALALRAFRRRK